MNLDDLPRWAKAVMFPVMFACGVLVTLGWISLEAGPQTLTAEEHDFAEGVSESIEDWFPWMLLIGVGAISSYAAWRIIRVGKDDGGENEEP